MTNELARNILSELKKLMSEEKEPLSEEQEALSMAISALEQEPKKLTCTLEDFKRFATENNYAILTTELYSKAITALEQEPCEDTISRADAIDQMEQSYNILDATNRIKALPSVTPSRRKGHWIYITEDKYRCSKCSTTTRVDESGLDEGPMYEFCPYCGAEMGSEG